MVGRGGTKTCETYFRVPALTSLCGCGQESRAESLGGGRSGALASLVRAAPAHGEARWLPAPPFARGACSQMHAHAQGHWPPAHLVLWALRSLSAGHAGSSPGWGPGGALPGQSSTPRTDAPRRPCLFPRETPQEASGAPLGILHRLG